MKTQSTTSDCRCKACGALLAKLDRDGLTIRRGDMQVVVSGDSTVAVTCYDHTLQILLLAWLFTHLAHYVGSEACDRRACSRSER